LIIYRKKELNILQTIGEEIANACIHGLGILLSIIGLVVLLYVSITQGRAIHIVSSALYGGSLIILYVFSTLYHAITHETAKKVLRRFDHISIYLLIAGTYIPLTLVILKGTVGWVLFGLECGLCLAGVIFKAIFGPRFGIVSAIFYLLMGWLALFAIKPLSIALSSNALFLIFMGGVFYTIGIIFFAADQKFTYFHAIWHLFVLAGSVCHFFMILFYVIQPSTLTFT